MHRQLMEKEGGLETARNGPFTEAKELIAGYSIIQVKSQEEAIEWVKRSPALVPTALPLALVPSGRYIAL